ncbi:hypothetical protein [Cupriavidus campinensis]|uniref:hypothetical protein n=1 Tax=Cupriavidus campinensis TaxID=151783 RepID=UPI0024E21BF0|nr:hypothetical protein [Cupriavidus campinensis]
MTAAEAVARVADHENQTGDLVYLLQRASAALWVAEVTPGKCNFADLRADIRAAVNKAYQEQS